MKRRTLHFGRGLDTRRTEKPLASSGEVSFGTVLSYEEVLGEKVNDSHRESIAGSSRATCESTLSARDSALLDLVRAMKTQKWAFKFTC
jgi:hypothetical protein